MSTQTADSKIYLGNTFAWDGVNLHLTDDSQVDKILKRHLSPSQSKAVEGCEAKMAAGRILPWPFDIMGGAMLGNVFHSILEDLFKMDAGERTREVAGQLLDDIERNGWSDWSTKRETFLAALSDETVRQAWRSACEKNLDGYFAVEDPTTIDVVATEVRLSNVEVGGVRFYGFIDRLDRLPSGKLRIVDYKTGKVPNLDYGDDHGDQLRLYSQALLSMPAYADESVGRADLLYVTAGQARRASLAQGAIKNTVSAFSKNWKTLVSAVNERTFTTQTSILCSWCPLVKACPAALQDGRSDIFKGEVVGNAYLPEELGIPTEGVETETKTEVKVETEAKTEVEVEEESAVQRTPQGEMAVAAFHRAMSQSQSRPSDFDTAPAPAPQVQQSAVASVPAPSQTQMRQVPPCPTSRETTDGGEIMTTSNAPQQVWHEGKPWEGPMDGFGNTNTGSYEFMNAMAITNLAVEQLEKAGVGVNRVTVTSLARTFENVLARSMWNLVGSYDAGRNLNSQMRHVFTDVIDSFPLPWGGTETDWQTWVEKVSRRIQAVVTIAREITDSPYPAAAANPWAALVGTTANPWKGE